MKYLLDTNIVVNHIRKKIILGEKVLRDGAAISIITLAELFYGAHKSDNPTKSLESIDTTIELLKLELVNLSEQIVIEFGNLKVGLEAKGQRLEDFDLLIGATAKTLSLILVTGNVKHFERITGLKLFKSEEAN